MGEGHACKHSRRAVWSRALFLHVRKPNPSCWLPSWALHHQGKPPNAMGSDMPKQSRSLHASAVKHTGLYHSRCIFRSIIYIYIYLYIHMYPGYIIMYHIHFFIYRHQASPGTTLMTRLVSSLALAPSRLHRIALWQCEHSPETSAEATGSLISPERRCT